MLELIEMAAEPGQLLGHVGAFGEQVMLCAASIRVGPFGQTFWAVLDRQSGEVIENTKQILPAQRGEVWTEGRGDSEPWQLGASGERLRTRIDASEATAKDLTSVGAASSRSSVNTRFRRSAGAGSMSAGSRIGMACAVPTSTPTNSAARVPLLPRSSGRSRSSSTIRGPVASASAMVA